MNFNKVILLFISIILTQFSIASGGDENEGDTSNEFNWGNNATEAQGYWLRLSQLTNQKDFITAYEPCSWLLNNAPDLNVDLYRIAAKVYKQRLKTEKDPVRKAELKDTILMIFDKHISNFNGGATVLNKKGKVAWLYQGRSTSNHDNLYKLYTSIYAQNGVKTYNSNLYFYFVTATRQYKKKQMTEEELLNLYDKLMLDLDHRLETAEASKKSSISKYIDRIDAELNKWVDVDCEFVMNNYGPKFNAAPSTELAHKIQKKLKDNKCVNNELYINTTSYLIEQEGPTYANIKTLGNIYLAQDKPDLAYAKFTEAIQLATSAEAKGNLYLKLAEMDRKKGNFAQARAHYSDAMTTNPELSSKGHNSIATLYLSSASAVSNGDVINDRLIYIAAYEEYKKAGNSTKMAEMKAQFPSMEELFVRNMAIGQIMKIGSWLNLSVKLDKRD